METLLTGSHSHSTCAVPGTGAGRTEMSTVAAVKHGVVEVGRGVGLSTAANRRSSHACAVPRGDQWLDNPRSTRSQSARWDFCRLGKRSVASCLGRCQHVCWRHLMFAAQLRPARRVRAHTACAMRYMQDASFTFLTTRITPRREDLGARGRPAVYVYYNFVRPFGMERKLIKPINQRRPAETHHTSISLGSWEFI